MNDIVGIVTGTLTSAGIVIGAVAWLFKSLMRPLSDALKQNSEALCAAAAAIKEQSEYLVAHDIRLTKIETMHDTKGCT